MTGYPDALLSSPALSPVAVPIVDWRRIGVTPPHVVPHAYRGPAAPLPKADVVVITWTTAEWSALDHVFLAARTPRLPTDRDWDRRWYLYSRDAPPLPLVEATAIQAAPLPPTGPPSLLWGYYQLVEQTTAAGPLRVLVFKSGTHLQHPPGAAGVKQMTEQILQDAQPTWIYSIGTAGGARTDQRLGDVVITNAARLDLKKPQNELYQSWTGQTYSCADFASTSLLEPTQAQLLFRMSGAVAYPVYEALAELLHVRLPESASFGVDDLVDPLIQPAQLHAHKIHALKDVPLLSTDYYYIGRGDETAQYSFLEMDDAVIARSAAEANTKFAFVRNISDPIVPSATPAGVPIPDPIRAGWSGLIYENFGFHCSYNGAVVALATIAAMG